MAPVQGPEGGAQRRGGAAGAPPCCAISEFEPDQPVVEIGRPRRIGRRPAGQLRPDRPRLSETTRLRECQAHEERRTGMIGRNVAAVWNANCAAGLITHRCGRPAHCPARPTGRDRCGFSATALRSDVAAAAKLSSPAQRVGDDQPLLAGRRTMHPFAWRCLTSASSAVSAVSAGGLGGAACAGWPCSA